MSDNARTVHSGSGSADKESEPSVFRLAHYTHASATQLFEDAAAVGKPISPPDY